MSVNDDHVVVQQATFALYLKIGISWTQSLISKLYNRSFATGRGLLNFSKWSLYSPSRPFLRPDVFQTR